MNAEPEVNHLWFQKDEILTFQEEVKHIVRIITRGEKTI